MMRSNVVLPQPDGPTSAATSPCAKLKARSARTWSMPPAGASNDFCLIATSSRSRTPACDMSFERLHQESFNRQHDGDEGQSIGQNARHVEELEGDPDLEPHAIGAAEQFDD